MNKARIILASLLLSAAPALAYWTPPTDEEITAAVASYIEKTKDLDRTDRDGRLAAAKEAAGELNIAELSVEQIEKLQQHGILTMLGKRDEIGQRLLELAATPDLSGARATLMAISYIPTTSAGLEGDELATARKQDARARAEAAVAALSHPGMPAAFVEGKVNELFSSISAYNAEALQGLESKLLAFEQLLSDEMPPIMFGRLISLFEVIASDKLTFEPGAQERLRTRILGLIRAKSEAVADDEKAVATLERARGYFEGNHARGQLLGQQAPQVDIIWSNHKEPIKSLADLRGQVVVIDFWATWCGPCIGSFPEVRELVAHYEGYPVTVLGVTSIQGYHINHKAEDPKARRIDTKDDPDREMALMTEFIQQMDVTWPVAFAKQDVFNPDFGVRGIPHVAILDPSGVVRYRGLHPKSPLVEKTSKIDPLLREAGLPVPAAPAAADVPTTKQQH